MTSFPGGISAITLFVDDLEATKEFFTGVFGLPAHYEDADSVVFEFGNILVNMLVVTEASELIAPAEVATTGSRFQLTITVDDVDAACALITERGATLLNGPMDRPWGIRTAAFSDPSGHVWELAG